MNEIDLDRIIEMAWEDRTPFDAIKSQFGIDEASVIMLMRKNLKEQNNDTLNITTKDFFLTKDNLDATWDIFVIAKKKA